LESFFILRAPGKDCTAIIHMSVEDDEDVGVVGTGDLELSQVAFKLSVAQREEELRMIFVEDLVGDSSAVDATKDLDKGVAIGLGKIWWESTIAGSGKKALEKSSWDVIAHELDFVLEATLDGCS
jgi:hypothetical protein